ncbi:MAG TPA: cupin domain-containing protein [Pseudolabrys sp.]|nr:cupin domain-containing protein [Pseudolabrys sp.]
MPFHRFEDMENKNFTLHLSTANGPVIEGSHLYFCLNQKKAGTGSELHYHPNELLIFVVRGKVNAVVGKDRRIAEPGTFIIIPPNVRHSMKATEDGECAYLYIKDRTWTIVGIGADEAPPERPLTMEESEEIARTGKQKVAHKADSNSSGAIIDGVPDCYYPMSRGLKGPVGYGRRVEWIEGERAAFGFFEVPGDFEDASEHSDHEQFFYVCDGALEAEVAGERKVLTAGDIAEVPRGAAYRLRVTGGAPARFVAVRATRWLEDKLAAAAQ